MVVRVLTWNLFHGRASPPRDADLLDRFAARLAQWEWDVALLQEAPPWWPAALAAACGAQERHALTSRNALLPLRRLVARRHPEWAKANGGGCDAILVRGLGVTAHARMRLRLWPERRLVHAVRDDAGRWFANVHASTGRGRRTREDVARAAAAARRWAGDAPLVLGGDFNMSPPTPAGLAHAGGDGIDRIYARGLAPVAPAELLGRGELSDHAPLRVTLA